MAKLILASASPRRKDLLALAGIDFSIQVPCVDEKLFKNEQPSRMVRRLSIEKAKKVASLNISSEEIYILAADTTVVSSRGQNLGKPKSRIHAIRMLNQLQGCAHFVFTGYTILKICKGRVIKKISRTIKTTVYFKKLSKQEIENYYLQGESMDKAGAYAAQGAGMMLVSRMNGSYTNVVGLPLSHVVDDLKKIGFTKK